MLTLPFVPLQSSYAFEETAPAMLQVDLDGGLGRYRRDIVGASKMVSATWNLPKEEYGRFMSFYQMTIFRRPSFIAHLVLDRPNVEEYEARFVPGSVRTTAIQGDILTITATLEVRTPMVDEDWLNMYWDYVEIYGDEKTAIEVINLLHPLVNIDLPAAVGIA